MKRMTGWLFVLLCVLAVGVAAAPKRNLELERIESQLNQFLLDHERADRVPNEIARVQDAIRMLRETSTRDAEIRQHLSYIAERRLDIAIAASEVSASERRLVDLAREHDQILLEASRRDAELARLESEKLRLQSLAQAEAADRAEREAEAAVAASVVSAADAESARAEADQARRVAAAQSAEATLARREAELAMAAADSLRVQMQSLKARQESRGLVMTLGESVFGPGQSTMQAEAMKNLDAVIKFVNQDVTRKIRIEGHTDARGSANLNQVLSQKRADSVKAALIAQGVGAERITALGRGADVPLATNDSAEGRARNRRVEVILVGEG
jgi:outer membrane protein OmpA-like peptidoglycan-associated protein